MIFVRPPSTRFPSRDKCFLLQKDHQLLFPVFKSMCRYCSYRNNTICMNMDRRVDRFIKVYSFPCMVYLNNTTPIPTAKSSIINIIGVYQYKRNPNNNHKHPAFFTLGRPEIQSRIHLVNTNQSINRRE